MKSFYWLLYLRGAINSNSTNVNIIFYQKSAHNLFIATMIKNCLKVFEQFIRFDDKGTRPERWEEDKYAAIRENFEILHMQNAKMYGTSKCISADEILCSRIGIKQ